MTHATATARIVTAYLNRNPAPIPAVAELIALTAEALRYAESPPPPPTIPFEEFETGDLV